MTGIVFVTTWNLKDSYGYTYAVDHIKCELCRSKWALTSKSFVGLALFMNSRIIKNRQSLGLGVPNDWAGNDKATTKIAFL